MLPNLELHRGSSMEFSSGTMVRFRKRWEEGLEEEVERRVKRENTQATNTSAHAWMIWNDTQARLEPRVTYERLYDNTSKRRASCSMVRRCHVRVSHGAHAISRNVLKVVEVVREDVRSFP